MVVSRSTAFISVFLLIAILSLAVIGIVTGIGTAITHDSSMEQISGTIVSMSSDHSFMLKTANGALEHFQCNKRCLGADSHMRRHLNEHAHTDVYYMRDADGTLTALDVD